MGKKKLEVIFVYPPILIATIIGLLTASIIGGVSTVLVGLGIVTCVLGLRHGLDAD